MTELMRQLKGDEAMDIGSCPFAPANLAALLTR